MVVDHLEQNARFSLNARVQRSQCSGMVMLTEDQKESVRRHLKKVLASTEFARSDRAAAFLSFIVQHALEERSEPLKERTIGIAVFDRAEDWDPKLDTIVRTEARRLRRKLTEFYDSPAGEDQFVLIDVPTGGYVPTFRFAEAHTAPETATSEKAVPAPITLPPSPAIATGTTPAKRPRWMAVVALCAIVLLAGLAYLGWRGATKRSADLSFRTEPLTSEYGEQLAPSLSPDGTQLAYVWDMSRSKYRIYLRSVAGGAPHRLTGENATELSPAFSPDGKQIAYFRLAGSTSEVVVRNLVDGSERTVGSIMTQLGDWTGDPGPLIGNLGPAWTPDSGHLVVSDLASAAGAKGLVSIRIADGSREQLTTASGSLQDFLPKVSPDGRQLAFVRALSHGVSDIYLLDMETKALTRITDEGHSINGLAWVSRKRDLVVSSNRQGQYQLWTLHLAERSFEKLATDSTTAIDPQIAASGQWIAYVATSLNWNVSRLTLDGAERSPERFISSAGQNHTPRFSPDGKHIAFVSNRSGSWEIWLCSIHCAEPQKLTDFRGPWIGGLSWSPDSNRLAFDARPGGKSAIYTMAIVQPKPILLEQTDFEERMPTWSLDGTALYFDSDRDGTISIWRRDLETGSMTKVGPGFVGREVDASGRMFVVHDDGSIWQVDKTGASEQPLTPAITAYPNLAWTVHGSDLFYCKPDENGGFVVIRRELSGVERKIADLSTGVPRTSASLDVSQDGRVLLFTSTDHASSNIYKRVGNTPAD